MASLRDRIARLEHAITAPARRQQDRAARRRFAAIFCIQADAVTATPDPSEFPSAAHLLGYARELALRIPTELRAGVDCEILTAASLTCWTNPDFDPQLARLAVDDLRINPGWTRRSWRERLYRMAGLCRERNPARSQELETWARALNAESPDPKRN